MDYHAIHGHDVASFDPPTTNHRMRTVAAETNVGDDDANGHLMAYLSTGLSRLDQLLGGRGSELGGVSQGQVTEVWGPPGAGKTSLGIQLVAGVLSEGRPAVWVDCLQPVCSERISTVVAARLGNADELTSEALDRFVHFTCPSLPHFIALLCRPTESCIPPGSPLVVIDGLTGLLNHSLPRMPPQTTGKSTGKGPSPGARRLQILQYIVTALKKLATKRSLAIVILSQCATKMQTEGGATLIPAVNAGAWEEGITSRIVLYRDFVTQQGATVALHFASMEKRNGKAVNNALVSDSATFDILPTGLVTANFDSRQAGVTGPKRKLHETDLDVADHEEEDYGWQDDRADDLPPLPSQWQGSEDLVVGAHRKEGLSSEDEQEEEIAEDTKGSRDPNDEIPASDDED